MIKLNTFLMSCTAFAIAGILNGCGGDTEKGAKPRAQIKSQLAARGATIVAKEGLLISEVAANYRRDKGGAWFEVFNNSSMPINLSSYKLRSGGLNVSNYSQLYQNPLSSIDVSPAPVTFNLPSMIIPAGGYFVLAGKDYTDLINAEQKYITANKTGHAYIVDPTGKYVPYWTDAAGFVELLDATDARNVKTADFVRFGTETTSPMTANFWNNGSADILKNVAAFPERITHEVSFSFDPLDHNSASIVRLSNKLRTTGTNNDWTLVGFPTPGGKNDVDGTAKDSDKDGIPDSAKVKGGTFAGLDLYGMGARPGQRDLFIHIDYMLDPNNPIIDLQSAALKNIVDAFQANQRKISVHFDAGNKFSPTFDAVNYNLSGNVSHEQRLDTCTQLTSPLADAVNGLKALESGCKNLYAYSSAVDVRRRAIFRYALMASKNKPAGPSTGSGLAELPGNKFQVTMTDLLSGPFPADQRYINFRINTQASTIMHELGHTLGLRHGGDVNDHRKPNYYSIMNYLYQLNGLPSSATGNDALYRYFHSVNNFPTAANAVRVNGFIIGYNYILAGNPQGTMTYCDVPEGPCNTPNMKIDYSDGSGGSLDEYAVDESSYIGRGADPGVYGNWNTNNTKETYTYVQYISDHAVAGVIKDHDDWAAIKLVVGRNYKDPMTSGYAKRLARPNVKPQLIIGTVATEESLAAPL
ncbi:hypothetical protein [Janthinobacterium sp. NKUCC06_STL]|uniref:hypothetical protein n=1 Tax=Janthinobacterium sp. NKUCC06_STL TaxID=2842127 RepID=UPI001C5B3711|nr:hypothetical protein [Janthinobacterium sp. NKUCC06_STL]MBW3512178.1 lamin tail domain-containing protein [Janthinobacterium sp. NKUCC06_STL]